MRQLGLDRVLQLTFGSGEQCYHLFLEFFAGGNIILCNHSMHIMVVTRPYDTTQGKPIGLGAQYPLEDVGSLPPKPLSY